MRLAILSLVLAFAAVATSGCSSSSCDSSNCTGCCDASGICQAPTASACGAHGAACQVCSGAQTCQSGICEFGSAANGSGTSGASNTTGTTSGSSSTSTTTGSTTTGTTTSSSSSTGSTGTTGQTDTQAPACTSLTLAPTSVDVSSGPGQSMLTLHITDIGSGFASGSVFQRTANFILEADFDASSLSSGTVNDGIYTFPLPVPQYQSPGDYTTENIVLYDNAGNQAQYLSALLTPALTATLQVADTNADTHPPQLESVSATPSAINLANGPGTVTVTFQLRDDLSGVSQANNTLDVVFTGPQGDTLLGGYDASNLTSGTLLDGIYTMTVGVPTSTPSGTYYLSGIDVADAVGNFDTFQSGHWGTATSIPSVTVQ